MKKKTIATVSAVLGTVGGILGYKYFHKNENINCSEIEKFKSYYNMLNLWLVVKEEGKNLEIYFEMNKYKSIAIYGMGEMGERLLEELKGSNIEVKYAIDKSKSSGNCEIKVVDMQSELENVDVVVVTPIFAFDDIRNELSEKIAAPIVSLEEVVFDTYIE